MMDKLMKLKEMKQGQESMRPIEKNAKMSVLKDLIGDAQNEMGEGLKGIKKVSVMAPNKQGLEKGLEKAKELIGGEEQQSESDDVSPEEADESSQPMECSPEEMAMQPEELDKKIEALMKLKEEKLSSAQSEE